ncbi:MAG: hypothetical protein OCC45_06415 [Desulfotalea sp.]
MAEKLKHNIMPIQGKIIDVDSFGENEKKRFKHHIVTKCKDEFSKPSGIIVISKEMLGTSEQVIECEVEFNGYVQARKWVDDNGENKSGKFQVASFYHVKTQ